MAGSNLIFGRNSKLTLTKYFHVVTRIFIFGEVGLMIRSIHWNCSVEPNKLLLPPILLL